jgi:hypothetical protein
MPPAPGGVGEAGLDRRRVRLSGSCTPNDGAALSARRHDVLADDRPARGQYALALVVVLDRGDPDLKVPDGLGAGVPVLEEKSVSDSLEMTPPC